MDGRRFHVVGWLRFIVSSCVFHIYIAPTKVIAIRPRSQCHCFPNWFRSLEGASRHYFLLIHCLLRYQTLIEGILKVFWMVGVVIYLFWISLLFKDECMSAVASNNTVAWKPIRCSNRPIGENFVAHVIRPCCAYLNNECLMTSPHHCEILQGKYHYHAEHCSQVHHITAAQCFNRRQCIRDIATITYKYQWISSPLGTLMQYCVYCLVMFNINYFDNNFVGAWGKGNMRGGEW